MTVLWLLLFSLTFRCQCFCIWTNNWYNVIDSVVYWTVSPKQCYIYQITLHYVSPLANVNCLRHSVLIYFAAPGCVAFANLYPGFQSVFANRITGVASGDRQACEAGCRADSTCLSYQINMNPDQNYCWYQTDPGQLNQNLMATQTNVVEYIKVNNCACKYPMFSVINNCYDNIFELG